MTHAQTLASLSTVTAWTKQHTTQQSRLPVCLSIYNSSYFCLLQLLSILKSVLYFVSFSINEHNDNDDATINCYTPC